MGSTLETSIVFTVVILLISFLIMGPADLSLESLDDCRDGMDEIRFETEDSSIASFTTVGGVKISDCSPERFCTYITGFSDCYRIIYHTVADLAGGDEDD